MPELQLDAAQRGQARGPAFLEALLQFVARRRLLLALFVTRYLLLHVRSQQHRVHRLVGVHLGVLEQHIGGQKLVGDVVGIEPRSFSGVLRYMVAANLRMRSFWSGNLCTRVEKIPESASSSMELSGKSFFHFS